MAALLIEEAVLRVVDEADLKLEQTRDAFSEASSTAAKAIREARG